MSDKKIIVAKILTAHGVRGLVKLRVYLDNAKDIESYNPLYDSNNKPYEIYLKNPIKSDWVAEVSGITDRNDAERLRNTDLMIDRALLPQTDDNDVYYHDLMDLIVCDQEKNEIGMVKDVTNFGAGDVILITPKMGKDFYIPYDDVCVTEITKTHITIDNFEVYLA